MDHAHVEWVQAAVADYEPRLLRYALRLAGHEETARDAVQETFLQLCRRGRHELDGALGPWLFTVCRNCCVNALRKNRRLQTAAVGATDVLESRDMPPALVLERQDAACRALRLLEELTPNQRAVVRLKFEQGLSYQQISAATGLSQGNVGYLLHVALHKLRAALCDDA